MSRGQGTALGVQTHAAKGFVVRKVTTPQLLQTIKQHLHHPMPGHHQMVKYFQRNLLLTFLQRGLLARQRAWGAKRSYGSMGKSRKEQMTEKTLNENKEKGIKM